MSYKNCIFIGLFTLAYCLVFAQETVLCSVQKDNIKIESTADLPTITNNTDGTVTLAHQDQNITDIFAQYLIYDFYQSYPYANPDGELIKYYTIVHGSRMLINQLHDYGYPSTYSMDPYPNTPISSTLIDLLDNKTYKLTKYCTESTEGGSPCPAGEHNIPDGFELKIAFEYDSIDDMMRAETVGVSSCGNSFSISMKGGYDDGFGTTDNTLQLWESEIGTSILTDYDQPCHHIEKMLYSVLDIGCYEYHNYGNIRVNIDNGETGQFVLERENAIFATDFLTFQDNELSIAKNTFNTMYPFQIKGSPYLQINNLNNQTISVLIYNTTGQQVFQTKKFEENSLNISNFSSGLYFIKILTLKNHQKIFKFLKN